MNADPLMDAALRIVVLKDTRIEPGLLAALAGEGFGDMVKYVADLARGAIAIGGDLHADAEAALLADGSRQEDLWGANFYPRSPPGERIQFTSLINIRPRAGNPSMEVQDPKIREAIRGVSERLILGRDEELP
jgi:hypothetical protein